MGCRVRHQHVNLSLGFACAAAEDLPNARLIAGIEFLYSSFLFDDLWPVESNAPDLCPDQCGAKTSGNRHSSEAADLAGDYADHIAPPPESKYCGVDLTHCQETEIGFLNSNPTGV